MQKWRETVHDQQAVDAEYRLRGKNGMYRWMSVHAVPLRTKDGRIVRWSGINIDIDDRRQLEITQNIKIGPSLNQELPFPDTQEPFTTSQLRALVDLHEIAVLTFGCSLTSVAEICAAPPHW